VVFYRGDSRIARNAGRVMWLRTAEGGRPYDASNNAGDRDDRPECGACYVVTDGRGRPSLRLLRTMYAVVYGRTQAGPYSSRPIR
jgi:hypothetical protein